MKYIIQEFRPGLFHIIDKDNHPIYDNELDGKDKPLVFSDYDVVFKYYESLNTLEREEIK